MKKLLGIFLILIAIVSPIIGVILNRYLDATGGETLATIFTTAILFFAALISAINIFSEE